MANRLARERSPYLLQHANNPVDWYPWGDEAFAAARTMDRPIFLSIGYSTCHWCHVMEHESFEDASVAKILNDHFIAIKVDREERPDVDRVYMTFVQATTGAGGWPMSVWLTPELKPFVGGTYFPPTSRWGRPGFTEVLTEIARAWKEDRPRVTSAADTLLTRLRDATGSDGAAPDRGIVAGREAIDAGTLSFEHNYDVQHGGFGGAPKFPRPSELLFLLQASSLTGDAKARLMALETLHAMAFGGMRDQIGGGFHRYSVDAEWRVPHFEKMLYDQAQLVLAYLEAYQVSGDAFYASVAEDTLAYVLRDLTAADGAFLSAEDADSEMAGQTFRSAEEKPEAKSQKPEKREGAFYVWTAAEIDRLFGADAPIVRRRFGIEDSGNALADPQGEFTNQNIPYIAQSIEEIAARTARSVDDVMAVLGKARQVMFDTRSQRPRPHRDDKVITAWNGLMIAAFARAGRVLAAGGRAADWRKAAERAAASVRTHLWSAGEKRLLRRHRDGESAIDAFAEDYACLAWGLLELTQTSGDARWLEWAAELTSIETERFFDPRDGGWFSTTGEDRSVLLRLKEDYDGAEPSSASVTVRNLLTLGHLSGDQSLISRAGRTLERYGAAIGKVARVMPMMMSNLAMWHGRSAQLVIAGPGGRADTEGLKATLAKRYLPFALTIPLDPSKDLSAWTTLAPWLASMRPRDDKATAYVCFDFTCREPVTDPAALDRLLEDAAAPRRIIT